MALRERVQVKTPEQVRAMRRAGVVVAAALDEVRAALRPGVTTAELDVVAAAVIRAAGATPSFLGYHGYPASTCVSVNDEVVHGIPGPRVLQPGDVVSVDCGAVVDGWHGDAAFSAVLDPADPADLALVAATERAMWAGIAALAGAARTSAVGAAVDDEVADVYGIVEEYVGHGIGTSMHMDPNVPNYATGGRSPVIAVGMALAVEPMVCAGARAVETLDDDWTVVTVDGRHACHWEHTVAVTAEGPWVLTALDGGAARFAALGVASPAATRA